MQTSPTRALHLQSLIDSFSIIQCEYSEFKILIINLWPLLQPEDLIKALVELENSASQDAAVREKIANLPAEVQDVSLLEKIEGMLIRSSS